MVEVTPGDIKHAKGNPDAVSIAIHPEFYPPETYLITGLVLPAESFVIPASLALVIGSSFGWG